MAAPGDPRERLSTTSPRPWPDYASVRQKIRFWAEKLRPPLRRLGEACARRWAAMDGNGRLITVCAVTFVTIILVPRSLALWLLGSGGISAIVWRFRRELAGTASRAVAWCRTAWAQFLSAGQQGFGEHSGQRLRETEPASSAPLQPLHVAESSASAAVQDSSTTDAPSIESVPSEVNPRVLESLSLKESQATVVPSRPTAHYAPSVNSVATDASRMPPTPSTARVAPVGREQDPRNQVLLSRLPPPPPPRRKPEVQVSGSNVPSELSVEPAAILSQSVPQPLPEGRVPPLVPISLLSDALAGPPEPQLPTDDHIEQPQSVDAAAIPESGDVTTDDESIAENVSTNAESFAGGTLAPDFQEIDESVAQVRLLPTAEEGASEASGDEEFMLDMEAVAAKLRESDEVCRMLSPEDRQEQDANQEGSLQVSVGSVASNFIIANPTAPIGVADGDGCTSSNCDPTADSVYPGLPPRFHAFLDAVANRPQWPRDDITKLAREHNLMLAGAMEAINRWSWEHHGDWLIDEGDPATVQLELLVGV